MDPARMVKSAVDLWAAGDRAAALKLAEQIVQRLPYQPRANELLGIAHALEGRWIQAATHIESALKAEPANPNLHFALGTVRGNAGDAAASAASMRKALDCSPGFTQAMIPLAMALIELGRSSEAEDVLRRALAKQPGWPDALGAMASLLTDRSQTVEAERILREAAAAHPGQPALLRMLCQTLNYIEGAEPAEAKALRERQGKLLPAPAAARPGAVPNPPDPERRLRVAYLSPDLRRHSVAYFVESFIGRHDAAAFEVFCYSTGAGEDDTTNRIKAAVPHWRRMHGAPDAALLQQIRADQIDILIELSGLTGGDRLAAIAPRAAPVQVTYIGCPSSTGVPAIDLRLVDAMTDPPGAEVHASERLIRLDGCFLCYRPPDEAPRAGPATVREWLADHLRLVQQPGQALPRHGRALDPHHRRGAGRAAAPEGQGPGR
jgi:predicted O-linked N-acetylglucosamine transferase (SPINDLY family)